MMDEDGNWQYKEITERAKAFEDWKKFIDNKQKLKNIEKNPAEADRHMFFQIDYFRMQFVLIEVPNRFYQFLLVQFLFPDFEINL